MFSSFFFLIKSCPVACTIKSPYEYEMHVGTHCTRKLKTRAGFFIFLQFQQVAVIQRISDISQYCSARRRRNKRRRRIKKKQQQKVR